MPTHRRPRHRGRRKARYRPGRADPWPSGFRTRWTTGVGFDLAGAERGNPPSLFREAYEIARRGGLGMTVHAGEDEGPERIWEAVDLLGADRIGHGCSAVSDRACLRRLARDRTLVECCITSNFQTGAAKKGAPNPIFAFMEAGIPVAVCTDNTTVSGTDQIRENRLLLDRLSVKEIEAIHREATAHSFVRQVALFLGRRGNLAGRREPRTKAPGTRRPSGERT